jgi:uncharacterized protein YdaU (DUF1376 family)
MKRPWMPFWPGNYLQDTQHLSTAEHGAYFLLILHYWLHDGLPDDDAQLAIITRLPLRSWRKMRPTIEAFFQPGWRHKRIDQDLMKTAEVSARRQVAGSIGGTRAAIARHAGQQLLQQTHSKRPANVAANGVANGVAGLQLKEEDIYKPIAEPRAREAKPPTNQAAEPAAAAASGLPMGARGNGIATSGSLAEVIAQKGWVS